MAQYSIGDALSALFDKERWKPRMHEVQLKESWNDIAGATIAKYTSQLKIVEKTLFLSTEVAALKHEILFSKQSIISRVNEHFGEQVITDLKVR